MPNVGEKPTSLSVFHSFKLPRNDFGRFRVFRRDELKGASVTATKEPKPESERTKETAFHILQCQVSRPSTTKSPHEMVNVLTHLDSTNAYKDLANAENTGVS